jgi:toxin ParE1/3/4
LTLEWSPLALADREAIFDYNEARSPRTAVVMDECIAAAVRKLRYFPEIGRPGRVEGTREIVVQGTPFIVAYGLAEETVRVLRVLHGSRRWPGVIE